MQYQKFQDSRALLLTDSEMVIQPEIEKFFYTGNEKVLMEKKNLTRFQDFSGLLDGVERIAVYTHKEIWESIWFYIQFQELSRNTGRVHETVFLIDRIDFWIFQNWPQEQSFQLISGPDYAFQLKNFWQDPSMRWLSSQTCRLELMNTDNVSS